jgi:hypothetical protein
MNAIKRFWLWGVASAAACGLGFAAGRLIGAGGSAGHTFRRVFPAIACKCIRFNAVIISSVFGR